MITKISGNYLRERHKSFASFRYSFLCPNGTLFEQQYFICDWWFNVDCSLVHILTTLRNINQTWASWPDYDRLRTSTGGTTRWLQSRTPTLGAAGTGLTLNTELSRSSTTTMPSSLTQLRNRIILMQLDMRVWWMKKKNLELFSRLTWKSKPIIFIEYLNQWLSAYEIYGHAQRKVWRLNILTYIFIERCHM